MWLLSAGPAILSLAATIMKAGTGLIHTYIATHASGGDHKIVLDEVNNVVQTLNGAVNEFGQIVASAPASSPTANAPASAATELVAPVHAMSGVGAGALP